jgi:undecaprenyl-diphosphatase
MDGGRHRYLPRVAGHRCAGGFLTVLFICVPRAYLGFHYPTDLLVGAALGIGITYVMTRDAIRVRYAIPALRWIERYPGPSAMLAFILCLELVTQFDELRRLASGVLKYL